MPKRRLFELLKSQGVQANQSVIFLTDGGETVRGLPEFLIPESEHWLAWFPITLRLTVMGQMLIGMVSRRGRGQTRRPSKRTAAGAESVYVPTWGAAHWRQSHTSWPCGAGTSTRPSFTASTEHRGHDRPALLSRSRCGIAWHLPPSPRFVSSLRH